MPLYEYRCVACKAVSLYLRSMDRCNEPETCVWCGKAARRIFSKPHIYTYVQNSGDQVLHDSETWR